MTKNEATLEARLDAVLTKVFPTFRDVNVEHQKSFSLKFGHHNVEVDLKAPSTHPSRAILDILLTIDGRNIILLELKKEGLVLTEDDVSQGISYARLVHPMPPLTLISNGIDNQFYNTYTKEKIETESIDLNFIQTSIDNSFLLARKDFKDAISLLLNREPEVFSKIINQISDSKFQRLLGNIDDFMKPICIDFILERQGIENVETLFSRGASLVGVVGSAFSGKTNLFYQFFSKVKSQNNFLLYIDCHDHNYPIFQQLANHFTQNAKILITVDKIREWLLNSLSELSQGKFYLLLDNFNSDIPEIIKNEIIELIDIFKGANHHILYTIDEFNYKRIAYVENRQYKTIIGEQSKIIKLDELNDDEYNAANLLLFDKYRISIEHGGHFTPEYREPRILRHLVSINRSEGEIDPEKYTKIDAAPNINLLDYIAANKTYTPQIHDLYQKITFCFFAEKELRKKNADLNIMASGSGAVTTNSFKKLFSADFETLIKSSVVVLREIRNGMTIIYPKFQELIANHSIPIISKLIIEENSKGKSIEELCTLLIETVTPIPYCDIVGNGVLLDIARKNEVTLFSELVLQLLQIPPRSEKIEAGTKFLLYTEDMGHVQINFEDGMDEDEVVVDFLPFAILSQIAAYPLSLMNSEKYAEYAFHHSLLYEIGSSKEFLRRADVRSLHNMKSFEHVNWKGVGYLVSGHEGIIEPIVQSIQKCFLSIPDEIKQLYERGFEENNVNLLYRIYLALRTMINFSDPILAGMANDYVKRFEKYFHNYMTEFIAKEIQDPEEREAFRAELLRLDLDKEKLD